MLRRQSGILLTGEDNSESSSKDTLARSYLGLRREKFSREKCTILGL
jgi:hypothetical protein